MNDLIPVLFCAVLSSLPAAAAEPLYKDPAAPVEARVEDLLARMTLDEKVEQLSGVNSMDLPANGRLGIPRLRMTDGPLGVRLNGGDKATAFPSGILMAASFDPELVARAAAAMAAETLAAGRDMLLGPCVNIARVPQGGRNFESYGEDPWLASRLAAAFVGGLQGRKVLASVKHYALNNQEIERGRIDVRASERAIHEIFLPAFEAAVRAGAWTIMAAYNKINGRYASENDYLLNKVLKERWGFKGFVVSDWGATHSTAEAANGGLDVEMPSGKFFGGGKLQNALAGGTVSQAVIDDKVRRVLRVLIGGGIFDRKDSDRPSRAVTAGPEHRALALEAAQKGIVLLKNDGILPLAGRVRTVAVLGPAAAVYCSGGGSSQVPPAAPVSALEGLRGRAGPDIRIDYAAGVKMPVDLSPVEAQWFYPPPGKSGGIKRGLYAEYYNTPDLKGEPAVARVDPSVNFFWGAGSPWTGVNADNFSVRWTGSLRVPGDGTYDIAVRADDGTRLWVDGELVIDDWNDHIAVIRASRLRLEAGRDHELKLEYYEHTGGAQVQLGFIEPVAGRINEAAAAAAKADAVVVFAGYSDQLEGEGMDRSSLELPEGQDELIETAARLNKNVVVVLQAGSPVLIGRWADKVKAIVQAWYPGVEGGNAIADVLLGRVNPSGKLPVTWPKRWEDSPAFGNYPGKAGAVEYAEGIFTGYRYFDKKKIAPRFPFGYGLSYTSFSYSNIAVKIVNGSALAPEVEVSLDIKNTGLAAGAEVAQLYVHDSAPKVARPEAELKGFSRVELAPGETKRVSFRLDKSAFAFYDEGIHDWRAAPGAFELRVGASSRDVRLKKNIELN
jgi:beta-glucosidase